MALHAPYLLATSAAKGLFWVGGCVGLCVCVVAWFSVWRSAARQQPLLGSEAMWGLRLPLCRGLACPVTPNELL